MKRRFHPWVGKHYFMEGFQNTRLLILGESHYGTPEQERDAEFTKKVVQQWGQQQRSRFFTVVQKLVTGSDGWVSDAERAAFWDCVAFCNYVQRFPGESPRSAPTPEMWEEAKEPFLRTIEELRPNVLIILGLRLRDHVPIDRLSHVRVCTVAHPAGGGFRYDAFREAVRTAMNQS